MQEDLEIKHEAKSFSYRFGFFLRLFFGTLLIVLLISLVNEPLNRTPSFIGVFALVFGGLIGYYIWQNKLYVADVESNSNIIKIRYYNKKVEHKIITDINRIKVRLKNTSSRAGFDCELKLIIDNKNYVITDIFDWSLSEMKLLFEYIKYFKNELPTEQEIFILSKMTEKIKKTKRNKKIEC